MRCNITYACLLTPFTPWCRVLLEKLTGLQLVKKFPSFHGPRRFITALTSVRYLSVSWANPIQSICPHPTSWRSILILSTHLRLGLSSGLLPSGFPSKTMLPACICSYLKYVFSLNFRFWIPIIRTKYIPVNKDMSSVVIFRSQ